jgi:hypothetical protein
MNWLIEDMSSNKKRIFVNRKDMQRIFNESNQNKLRENKDNKVNIEEGLSTYKKIL